MIKIVGATKNVMKCSCPKIAIEITAAGMQADTVDPTLRPK